MSDWEPATHDEVESLLRQGMAELLPGHREHFEAMRVPFRDVPVDSYPGETVVVVAEYEGRILYFSDVENGWELEEPSESGGVAARGANQYELSHLMWQLFGNPQEPE